MLTKSCRGVTSTSVYVGAVKIVSYGKALQIKHVSIAKTH